MYQKNEHQQQQHQPHHHYPHQQQQDKRQNQQEAGLTSFPCYCVCKFVCCLSKNNDDCALVLVLMLSLWHWLYFWTQKLKNDPKLSKDAQALESEMQALQTKYNNKQAKLQRDYKEKIRTDLIKSSGMSEEEVLLLIYSFINSVFVLCSLFLLFVSFICY